MPVAATKMNALSAPYFVRPLHFKGGPDKTFATDDKLIWQPKDCFEKQSDTDSEDLQLLSKHQADYISARTPEGEPLLSWGSKPTPNPCKQATGAFQA